jgi:hypothetical protein
LHDSVELTPLSPRQPPIGAAVREVGPLVVPAGDEVDGRTLDCLGDPLDGGPPLSRDMVEPVFARDPTIIAPAYRRWTLGTLVYDLQHVFPLGASLLATGPREVFHHLLRHQVAMGRVVVLATPATTSAAQLAVRRGNPRMPPADALRCVHVAAADDATPAQQWLVPWTAMAIASGLRARGREVVVAIDDLDAWRPHIRRAWPTELAGLASRAYATPTGSVSLIAMTRVASTTRAAAFDDTLDLLLAARGELPRLPTKLVRPPIRVASMRELGAVSVANAIAHDHAQRGGSGASADDHTQRGLDQAARYRECMRVRPGATTDSLEQELALLAVFGRHELRAAAVPELVDAYLAVLRRDHAPLLATIRAAGRLTEHDERVLLAAAAAL